MSKPSEARPSATEYPAAVASYIQLLPDGDLLSILEAQGSELSRLADTLGEEQSLALHAPYTWTIKQVVGHLADCERVFGYRAMRLARGDTTPLPSFDENAYMRFAEFDRWPFAELVSEFTLLRRAHVLMLQHLDADAWLRAGVVSNQPMTARAVVCVMAGHARHHLKILKQRLGR